MFCDQSIRKIFKNVCVSFFGVLLSFSMCTSLAAQSTSHEKIFGLFPGDHQVWQLPRAANAHQQQWSGYCPPCTLKNLKSCEQRPCQKKNMLEKNIYDGINVASDRWMRLANLAAKQSVQQGGGPFGAVILQIDDKTGRVIRYWMNHNRVVENSDPTAHAEIETIRMASKDLGVFDLGHINQKDSKLPQPHEWSHCIIYSSAEPCPMCYAAIYWAGMKVLIFAASRFDAAAKGVNFSDAAIYESLKKPYKDRSHVLVRHAVTKTSLGAFNYYKRTSVKRYGSQ